MRIRLLALASTFVAISICPASSAGPRVLKKNEVENKILGHQCTLLGTSQKFRFKKDGTYQFQKGAKRTPVYHWSWAGSSIRGATTTYTFYESGDSLAYKNTKIGITLISCS